MIREISDSDSGSGVEINWWKTAACKEDENNEW